MIAVFPEQTIDFVRISDGDDRNIAPFDGWLNGKVFEHDGRGCNFAGAPEIKAVYGLKKIFRDKVGAFALSVEEGSENRAADKKILPDARKAFAAFDQAVLVILRDSAFGDDVLKQRAFRVLPAVFGIRTDENDASCGVFRNGGQAVFV